MGFSIPFLSAPKAPKVPNPQDVIAGTRYNQATPFGGQTWTPPTTPGGQWGLTSTLSPAQQQQLGSLEQLNQTGTDLAQGRLGGLPGAAGGVSGPLPFMMGGGGGGAGSFAARGSADAGYGNLQPLDLSQQVTPQNFSAEGLPGVTSRLDLSSLPTVPGDRNASVTATRNAVFNQQRDLLDPEFAKENRRLDQNLANQGLPMGSEAYNERQANQQDRQNFALNQLAQQAVLAGNTEDTRMFGQQMDLRNQGYNEQMGNANLGLAARGLLGNEGLNIANQNFNQQLGARKQQADEALGVGGLNQGLDVAALGANTSMANAAMGAGASNYGNELNYNLQNARLGQDINQQDFSQAMDLWNQSRGGLMQPNFQNSAGDAGGAYQLSQNAANQNYAGQNARYGANMGALGGLGAAAIRGGAFTGMGGAIANALPFVFSSVSFKHEFGAVDHKATLEKLATVPIYTYRYTPAAQMELGVTGLPRMGPMAEDFYEAFGGEDNRIIDLHTLIGVLFSAVKGLQEEVEQLRAGR